MSYASLTEFKAYLKIPTGTTGEDTLLQTFLNEADALIDDLIGRPSSASAATTRYYDVPVGDDPALLLFGRVDVCCAITSVVNGDGTTVSSSSYVPVPRNEIPYYGIRLRTNAGVEWVESDSGPEAAIAVTGKWAYTTNADGTADNQIKGAALILATWLYRQKDNVADMSRPVQTPDGMTILPLALPSVVLDRLKLRRPLL